MAWTRWTLEDESVPETVTFPINPNEVSGLDGIDKTTQYVQPLIVEDGTETIWFEGPDKPRDVEAKGVILDTGQRDLLIEWADKRNELLLTTDIDETYRVYITSFLPTRKRVASRPYRADYTLKMFIVGPVT